MRKPILTLLLTTSIIAICFGQSYNGPIPKITNGYGSFGPHQTMIDSFKSKQDNQLVSVFHPEDIGQTYPTILYCHGYGITKYTSHLPLINFLVSQGNNVIYSPYPSTVFHDKNNNTLLNGFLEAAQNYPHIIDTTKIGIIGHSYGAGAAPWVGKKLFKELKWGAQGKFMFLSASWFIRQMSQEDLETFPSDCKFICQVNEFDNVNDHRMSIDLFCNINIPNSEKDYIIVPRDTIADKDNKYIYLSEHNMIGCDNSSLLSNYDAQDVYAIFRLVEALAKYTFENDLNAKQVALGNGHKTQIKMGDKMKPLIVTDYPKAIHPETYYQAWPCHTNFFGINPRIKYCDSNCGDTITTLTSILNNPIKIYPNPTLNGEINLDFSSLTNKTIEILMYDIYGQLLNRSQVDPNEKHTTINLSKFQNGVYLLHIKGEKNNFVRIIKK